MNGIFCCLCGRGCSAWPRLLSAVAGEPEKYTLRYKFHPGETIRWEVEHRSNVRTTVSGTTQTAETLSISVKAWRVAEVQPDGTATFEHSVEWVDMRQKLTGRDEVRYNSRTDAKPPRGLRRRGQVGRRAAVDRHHGRHGQGVAPRKTQKPRPAAAPPEATAAARGLDDHSAARRSRAGRPHLVASRWTSTSPWKAAASRRSRRSSSSRWRRSRPAWPRSASPPTSSRRSPIRPIESQLVQRETRRQGAVRHRRRPHPRPADGHRQARRRLPRRRQQHPLRQPLLRATPAGEARTAE